MFLLRDKDNPQLGTETIEADTLVEACAFVVRRFGFELIDLGDEEQEHHIPHSNVALRKRV